MVSAPQSDFQTSTDARPSYDYHRTLLESIPQRVFFKDTRSVFVLVNPAFAADLGLRPEEMTGKTDFDFCPAEYARKYRDDDQRVMTTGVTEKVEEINLLNGQPRIVEVTKTPVSNDRQEVIGVLGIYTDITARKRADDELKLFAAKLEQSNRELQAFASVASHDLQEPLRKIQAFGDRLKTKCGDALDDAGRDYLERMQSAARRMQTLINDLLSFSRVATQTHPFAPVDLGEVARQVISDLEVRLEETGGRVEVGRMLTIEADALQMRQLLQNLIGNALKFHRPGVAPVVHVGCELIEPKAKRPALCRLVVADNGIGFDEKYLDRIFNVFQRLHSRQEYEGTGVGLAIARRIAERHAGQITARSAPAEGAAFTITLPLVQPAKENLA